MVSDKKESFLDRLKKKNNSGGDNADGGFSGRFSQNQDAPVDGQFSQKFTRKEEDGDFQSRKGVVKSKRNPAGFADDVRRKRSDCVYLVRGNDRGRAAWHYVLVDKSKKEMFLAAAKSGSLDVKDYGEILYSGWGQDPPEDIKNKIDEEYN